MIGVLLLFLPAWTAGVALWDGAVRGFSVLWLAAPPAVFLLPMLTVFNSSAAIYGILYALIGGVFSGIGHLGVYRVRRQPVSEDEGTPLRAQ